MGYLGNRFFFREGDLPDNYQFMNIWGYQVLRSDRKNVQTSQSVISQFRMNFRVNFRIYGVGSISKYIQV